MKYFITLSLLFIYFTGFGQSKYDEAKTYQENLVKEYKDQTQSPLTKKDLKKFKSLPFFPIDTQYVVIASVRLTPEDSVFEMPTTTLRKPKYRRYGVATFTLKDTVFELNLYENLRLKTIPKYKDYLFLPFKDFTNGNITYGGGRYVEPIKLEGNSVLIDFNRAYNPFCAYNSKYSCPLVPDENSLETYILAGVQYKDEH